MKPAERLYGVGMPIWKKCFEHPFVKGIGDGTLKHDKVCYFMIQDHKYLMDYAKTFALGIVASDDEEDLRTFAGLITSTIDTENEVHREYLEELGITREMIDGAKMSFANRAYCKYMIAKAAQGGIPEILASALACSWSYKVIGDHLARKATKKDHPFYARWIEMYSGKEYSRANDDMIALVNKHCAGLKEERMKRLEEIVIDCSKFELMFWDDAWSMGEAVTVPEL